MSASHLGLLSPDTDTFSTPPTTPGPLFMGQIRPSLSRRSSRPTSLHINQAEWASDIVLEEESPKVSKKHNGALSPPSINQDRTVTPRSSVMTVSPPQESPRSIHDPRKAMDSPCFVHSHLDKGASLTDWLRNKQHALIGGTDVGVAKSLQQNSGDTPQPQPYSPSTISPAASSLVESDEDEDGFGGSLTKQLAETAVGVREMSKQLGQCLRLLPRA
jgi:NAD+ kinase